MLEKQAKLPAHEYKIAFTVEEVDGKWLVTDGRVLCIGDMCPSEFHAFMQAQMTHEALLKVMKGWESANWYEAETRWYYLLELVKRTKLTLYDSREAAEQARERAA